MTTPEPPQKPPLNPAFPAGWTGGYLDVLEPSRPDFYDEDLCLAARAEEMDSWAPLEDLTEGDPPEVWGLLEGAAQGGPSTPAAVEVVSGVVAHVAATGTGLLLEEFSGEWFDLSKFVEGLTLEGIGRGDVVVLRVEVSRTGRKYIIGIEFHQGPGA